VRKSMAKKNPDTYMIVPRPLDEWQILIFKRIEDCMTFSKVMDEDNRPYYIAGGVMTCLGIGDEKPKAAKPKKKPKEKAE
jgi:hypothetical protein